MRKKPVPAAIRGEEDPEWRAWFQDVHNRKNDFTRESRRLRIAVSEDGAGGIKKIVRSAASPLPVKKIIARNRKKSGLALVLDQETLTRVWRAAAGPETAGQSAVQGFRDGVLTVAVASAALLQEIRQFRQKALLTALRESWEGQVPLLRVAYRAGGGALRGPAR